MSQLSGIRVVEFCEIAAGPYCAMLLADMGAEVIKIERPSGDAMRTWPPLNNEFSENFASINRSKKSVVLNLKTADDVLRARQIALSADVLVENYRPGVMARSGLDYPALAAENPRLIYCSISAFGQTGPRAKEGGFDLTMQAMAGVMSVTGEPGGAPVKCGVPLCDFVSGLYGALEIVAALKDRDRSGQGHHIDVSMMGATLAIAALQTSEYFGTGTDPKKLGSAHPRNAPYQAFKASDGYFGMAAGNNNLWSLVCEVVERPDLAENSQYTSPSLRAANQETLKDVLEAKFAERPVAHWLSAFSHKGVPCSPIRTYSEALADPQVTHMGWVQDLTLPNGSVTRTFGPPVHRNGKKSEVLAPPPLLGQHTSEVLAELKAPASRPGSA